MTVRDTDDRTSPAPAPTVSAAPLTVFAPGDVATSCPGNTSQIDPFQYRYESVSV